MDVEPSVTRLPAVPDTVKELKKFVVPAVNVMVEGCTVLDKPAKRFAPEIVSAPAPPWLRTGQLLYPPPAKVLAVAAVMFMRPAPNTVKFEPDAVHAELAPVTVKVDPPKIKERDDDPVEEKALIVTAWPFVSKVPPVSESVLGATMVNGP